ncbi:MalY/PatB family protein [Arthrobacter castelli]|uniref:MalY/PatB family protein n=1 Tax=Arthrobacter castelli TaxID=271431 RepID=UPI000402EC3D|nr:aminotransferase class I/II-fold pyridoxal phosphate-dependent enzyme [Arthrobacter castelli]
MTVQFDAITEESLRARGSKKWSTYPGAIPAFVAEMDFGTAPAVTSAVETAVAESLFGYMPDAVDGALSEATSRYLQDSYAWKVEPANIRPLPDVLKGLEVAIEYFSEPGSAVVLPTPAYMPFLWLPRTLDREIIQVPMLSDGENWALDLDGIDEALSGRGGLLVFCNPHNPIGKVYRRDEMRAVADIVDRHNARVFSDEIHAPLIYPGSSHIPYASVSAAAAAHTITATSASKAWNLPGLKCAQLILTNDDDAKVWADVGFMAEHGASNLGVVANTAAYAAGHQWLSDVLAYLDSNRKLLSDLIAEHLPGVSCTQPDGTYLAWLDCRALEIGESPQQFFLNEAGVACTDGADCGDAGTGFVRFNFAMPKPVLTKAIKKMGQAVSNR